MLFSTMCWLFCYCFLIILDTTVHLISNESEDMKLLKPIFNYNCMQLCFNLKIVLDKLASRSQWILVLWREHQNHCEQLLVAKWLKTVVFGCLPAMLCRFHAIPMLHIILMQYLIFDGVMHIFINTIKFN